MKIIVRVGYFDHIFNIDEGEEAMEFALTAALRKAEYDEDDITIRIKSEEEEDDNEE